MGTDHLMWGGGNPFAFRETGRIFRAAPLANDIVAQRDPCGFARGMHRSADAEQAKATGGMVALMPRQQDAEMLAVPGGEPVEELHMTVIYLGQDVQGQDPTELINELHYVAGNFQPIEANVFGQAVFNASGEDPCKVYLVGGSPDITGLFRILKDFVGQRYPGAAEQHDPFVPHVTAAYGTDLEISYEGPVLFDRIGLRWPGADQDFIL